MSTTVIIDIAATSDNGTAVGGGTSYPPPYSSANADLKARKNYSAPDYLVSCGLVKFDTSSIPDGATITSAKLKLKPSGTPSNADTRQISIGYHAFTTIGSSDYTATAETDANSGVALSSLTANVYYEFPLSNLTSINKTGYTGFRLHISGGQPTGSNDVLFNTYANGSSAWPKLEITYDEGWNGKIFGVKPAKIFGVVPKKVNGI